jgi:hypothetical protein
MTPATTLTEAIAIEKVCMSTNIDTQKTRLGGMSIKDYIMDNWESIECTGNLVSAYRVEKRKSAWFTVRSLQFDSLETGSSVSAKSFLRLSTGPRAWSGSSVDSQRSFT